MSNNKYKWELDKPPPLIEEHSRVKHALYADYLKRYLAKLTSRHGTDHFRLALIDGFAGGGVYRDPAGALVSGSPLLLLGEVRRFSETLAIERTKPPRLLVDYYFVESDRGAVDYLSARVNEFPKRDDDSVSLLHGAFESIFEKILSHLAPNGKSDRRAIFVLDQYGWNKAPISILRRIREALPNAEVIATFAMDWLISYASSDEGFGKAIKRLGLRPDFVSELLEKRDAREPRSLMQHTVFSEIVAKSEWPFFTPFFLVSPKSGRSYWLLHLSSHHTARNEMGLSHWSQSNVSMHHGRAGLRTLGYDSSIDPGQLSMEYAFGDDDRARTASALLDDLPRYLRDRLGKDGGALSFNDVFADVCNETPAVKSDLSKALTALRTEKHLEIDDPNGKLRPRAMELDWKDKIRLPAQGSLFALPKFRP